MTDPVLCVECESPAALVGALQIYPHRLDLATKKMWLCACGAYVGCHPGTEAPLGRPCGARTRRARHAAHKAFDVLWETKMIREGCTRYVARGDGYRWLAGQLGIDAANCHIAMMDAATCKRVVQICTPFAIRVSAWMHQARKVSRAKLQPQE